MSVPDTSVVALLVLAGAAALGFATWLAIREAPAAPGTRGRATSPLVPWLGSAVAVLLAIRGALAAAAFVLFATVVHAVVARWRALVARRRDR
jgi:hypothetical protein